MKNLIVVAPYNPQWPLEFRRIGTPLRIDHIGSTAVPSLSAKDVIDVQFTVATLDTRALVAAISALGYRFWDDITGDHLPPGRTDAPEEWSKLYFSAPISMSAKWAGPINATPYSSTITSALIQVSPEPTPRSRKRSSVLIPRISMATMT